MKVIKIKRVKNLLERGNKPEDGEVKVMPHHKPKRPQGSRRPRNRGRG